MVKRIQYIALIYFLLLLGGLNNDAWAVKVTYHVLTMPFTPRDKDPSDPLKHRDMPAADANRQNIRVEAFYVIVDETSPTVGLPSQFISPLAKNFRYYEGTATSESGKVSKSASGVQIYQYNTTTYYTYTIHGTSNNADVAYYTEPLESYSGPLLKPGSAITEDCHIYVTYEYNPANTVVDLAGNKSYNIKLGDRFLAFNKGRANRPAAILADRLTEENLNSDDFTYVANPGFSNQGKTHYYYHFRFKFDGPDPNTHDPYNITIYTAYEGNETFFSDTNKNIGEKTIVLKWYKDSRLFCKGDANGAQNMWLSSDYDIQFTQTDKNGEVTWESTPGYYRGGVNGSSEMKPIWNSFAILPAPNGGDGYVFMGTKINGDGNEWQPKKDGNVYKYFFLTGNVNSGNNPKLQLKAVSGNSNLPETTPEEPYEVRTYTFKVKTPLSDQVLTAKMNMTEYIGTATLLSHIPDKLKRKYVTFTGAYKSETFTDANAITYFNDVEAANNNREIWLKYESDMPFESLPKDGSFEDARWYTIRMNGDHEDKYIAYLDGSNFSTGRGSNSVLHEGENSLEAQVAFIGDPFELKIISHAASEAVLPNANRYIGCGLSSSAGTLFSAVEGNSSYITSWEIVNDDIDGIQLRQCGTYDNPWYFGWNYGASNNPIIYTNDQLKASRIKVVEMDKKKYYYHIINSSNEIAVMASEDQDVGKPLKFANIPEIIRSPFINPDVFGATIKFYYSKDDALNDVNAERHAPFDVTASTNKDIYVRYTVTLASNNFHVRLNNRYIYYNLATRGISSSAEPVEDGDDADKYIWHLNITDPYAMTISNTGIEGNVEFVKVVSPRKNKSELEWATLANASKFVTKSGGISGNTTLYEVMETTGDGVDVSTEYYNIGRTDNDEVIIYSNDIDHGGVLHGNPRLLFQLTSTSATAVDYHLIDKSNNELLVVRGRSERLDFPDEWKSPLVGAWHYFATKADAVAGTPTINNLDGASDDNLDGVKEVYVTYDANNLINLRKGQLYLLKFQNGDRFRQENGSDGLTDDKIRAVYPYCNGDCNFFIYGQDEYELQQQGAASTRTRWAWYAESADNDPYHVKICSRQIESFNGNDHQAYFYTFTQNIGGEDKVVTSLAWPGITGVHGTEYMVLGSKGYYHLTTTPVDLNGDGDFDDSGEDNRYVVKSFEQYWKTYDTIKNKLLNDILEEGDKGANPEGSTLVPTEPASYRARLTGTGEGQYDFHSYDYWAYAKRFNGYNASGATSKGWEQIEHWYQTVNMGDGIFDFVETVISPVLILLDQHGWEVMRKPLPYSNLDPKKEQKKNVLRAYDSPMVKEYYYWASAKKRSGFHQYYQLDKRIGGSDYTSTSLGNLPEWGSENVLDAKGNQNDQYVTYTVKDEYVKSYSVEYEYDAEGKMITGVTGTSVPFLIQQGDRYAFTNGTSITAYTAPSSGGMSQWIIDHISDPIGNGYLWYLKPNINIDNEMGYGDPKVSSSINWVNDYRDKSKVMASGFNSWAFDPYNIQISSVASPSSYFVTNATGATLEEGNGAIIGTYGGNTPSMTIGTRATGVTCSWYDSRALDITNTTFMAVQDADGNMQLMPRFDHGRRVRIFSTLVTPTDDAGDPTKLAQTHTKIFRPLVYNYHIIDNAGNESLRYQAGGDLVPQTPDHFKSPLAKDFKYYKTLTSTGTNTYDLSTLADEISESFAGKGLTSTTNDVYVRYSYNEESDAELILKGKWFTMKLNTLDAKYDDGIKQGTPKPTPMDATQKVWQWKFLETPHTDPDPYAVCLFNRYYNGLSDANGTNKDKPLFNSRFAILSHSGFSENNRVYALVKAGRGDYTYQFLNGSGMTTSNAAVIAEDADGVNPSGFTSMSCTFHNTDSKVELFDDVLHTYTYQVYTHDNVLAINANQSFGDASDNEFMPVLPSEIKSPLLNDEDFRYYYSNSYFNNSVTVTDDMKKKYPELKNVAAIPDTIGNSLQYMYGLYDDVVYVHYMPYNPDNSSFLVPNDKAIEDDHAARGSRSNDAALGLDGNLLYNIIWYNDYMMRRNPNDTNIYGVDNQPLQATHKTYVWQFMGNDPYAIKIKSYGDDDDTNDATETTKFIGSNGTLSDTPQSFMLIPQDGYGYGVLAPTGNKGDKLTMAANGSAVSVSTTDAPTKFVFFALSTNTVIYHLMIKKTDEPIVIPYRGPLTNDELKLKYTLPVLGSTQRDLTSKNSEEGIVGEKFALGEVYRDSLYCKEVGPISLGDKLEIPSLLYRPNVVYEYYVEGVYDDNSCTTPNSELNNRYKGTKLEYMGDHPDLVGKTVFINVVYSFNGTLETNAGADFVRSVAQNKWYTFEAKKNDGTPQLMQFTNAWGMEVKEGRGTHYTNDYLWTPLGDPYGFKMYHRYTCVNSGNDNTGEPNRVMTTADFSDNQEVWMSDGTGTGSNKIADPASSDNSIYELLEGDTPGYFKIHPVANNSGTQYNLRIIRDHEDPENDSSPEHDYVRLDSRSFTEFTFGLTEELLKPYYDRAGYVGGLNDTGKAAYEAANGNLMTLQSVVYNPDNIVSYTPGYYRLHSPEDIEVDGLKINPVRYASGYTHKLELSNDLRSGEPVPMHFYEVEGKDSQFDQLKSKDGSKYDAGYTVSKATRGDIPIPAVEYDPASIFYFSQVPTDLSIFAQLPEGTATAYHNNDNMAIMSTQDLYVKCTKGPGHTEPLSTDTAYAVMTATKTDAIPLYIMDIGGGILLIHDQQTAGGRVNLKYLSYDQAAADHIYDLKLTHNTHTDHAKWLMQPANHLGLRVTTHSGGDGGTYGGTTYNYTSFYAPFDVMLPDTVMKNEQIETIYHAVILESAVSPWNPSEDDLHPKSIGRYNTTANGCPSGGVTDEKGITHYFRGNDRFIPAGTPVLIAMHDATGYVKMTLPNSTPHPMNSPFTSSRDEYTALGATIEADRIRTNILSGQYLEQKLALSSTERIYTFGLPFNGSMTLNPSTGEIEATLPLQDNSGMGFYLNANPNKEEGLSRGEWTRNNWYVYSNKVYYRSSGEAGARQMSRGDILFVPVNFDDYEGEEEQDGIKEQPVGDNRVYDLLGRCVATEEQVKDGTWKQNLRPGIYILNGRKIRK